MAKLTRYDIQKLEDYWINLSKYKKELKFREWELLNPHQAEEQVGSRSGKISDTTGNRAIILVEDAVYQNLQRIINCIEKLSQELTEDERVIVNLRYREKTDYFEWEDISQELGYSRRKVLKMRDNIIDRTAEMIGWV